MTKELDPSEIYKRGLSDLDSLVGPERLVFMLQDFDNLMEMEGWQHFFLYEHHFLWYQELKEWLARIGDAESLAVLEDFERYIRSQAHSFTAEGIEEWYDTVADSDSAEQQLPDWREHFSLLRESRWEKTQRYLRDQGLHINLA